MYTIASEAVVLSGYVVNAAMTWHVSKLHSQQKDAAGQNALAAGASLPARGLI